MRLPEHGEPAGDVTDHRPVLTRLLVLALGLWMVPTWTAAVSAVDPAARPRAIGLAIVYVLVNYAAVGVTHRMPLAARVTACGGILVLGTALQVLFGAGHSGILVYGLMAVATLLPPAVAAGLAGLLLSTLAVRAIAAGTLQQVDDLLITATVVAAIGAVIRLLKVHADLSLAGEKIAALAVNRERERLAGDLHDLLGHDLTTITAKAGLARRTLELTRDVERVVSYAVEIEEMSRRALTAVRSAVYGLHDVSLSEELENARGALQAIGATGDLPEATNMVAPELRRVFGFVVREAITNVVRHSAAKRVTIRVGERWIEVNDDGRSEHADLPGVGLRSMERRVESLGGRMQISRCPQGGFRIHASVPPRQVVDEQRPA